MDATLISQFNTILTSAGVSDEDRDLVIESLTEAEPAAQLHALSYFEENRDGIPQFVELLKRKTLEVVNGTAPTGASLQEDAAMLE